MPDINRAQLDALFTSFNGRFQRQLQQQSTAYGQVAMDVPSMSAKEVYPWLQNLPAMRKWVGDRLVRGQPSERYELINDDYEATVEVDRNDVEDAMNAAINIYGPQFDMLGYSAGQLWAQLVWQTLLAGFTSTCFDGQYFFDTDHPRTTAAGGTETFSNFGGGAGAPWFLIDSSKPIKPLLLQKRKDAELVRQDNPTDDVVFMRNKLLFGVHSRGAAGFTYPQLAYASKQTLDAAAYEATRNAMQLMKGNGNDNPLGIMPGLLVVGPTNEGAARRIVGNQFTGGGNTNEWYGTAEVLLVPELG